MNYIGNLIRPPSEADSIILQVTVGCSHNRCTFCGAYKDVHFKVKPAATVYADIAFAKNHFAHKNRVFLADGDVLILKQDYLTDLFKVIRRELPQVKRISLYGSSKAITRKTREQLCELKSLGLNRVYMGLESGCNKVLKQVKKGDTVESMVAAGVKVKDCGLFLSVTILLGLAGAEASANHAVLTASALNDINPHQIAALTLMVLENTPLGRSERKGLFQMIGPGAVLKELYILVSNLDVKRSQFFANHASNYLPLSGRMPKDKYRILAEIESALADSRMLVPENLRAL
ncbi:MAG: radical SAM protein [Deltaproteobacteria bacterium]|nr:radical SAM protein [Deltaproteobacteria bacterium]MBW2659972.1 radical SAM protein [Deltaproteobacteria bacterium]